MSHRLHRRLHDAWKPLAALGALCCALAPSLARAGPEETREDAGQRAGVAATPLSDEDREVIENLDLLQAMDEAGDLDLLLELGKAEGDSP